MSLYHDIKKDVEANCQKDEVNLGNVISGLLFNPGVRLLAFYRCAKWLRSRTKLGFWLSEAIWNVSVITSGCHISVDAEVMPGVVFPHPTGIVVGSGAVIRSGAVIYQNVTVGSYARGLKEYPTIESGAILYAGCCVVGATEVGIGAKVGANAFVSKSVPAAGSVVIPPAAIKSNEAT